MNITEERDVIFRTDDHSLFKTLLGNREVKRTRIEKIKSSINSVGYIKNPIIVNENYEIIDGQGRERALAELCMPVDFTIAPGAGIRECRAMNIHQSNWTLNDYIYSYATSGDPSYIRLKHLQDKYGRCGISLHGISYAISKGMERFSNVIIAEGRFTMNSDEYDEVKGCLDYISNFVRIFEKNNVTSLKQYFPVLSWFYFDEDKHNEILFNKVEKYANMLMNVATLEQAAEVIQDIYDFRRSPKTYLATEYKKKVDAHQQKKRILHTKGEVNE